MGDKKKDLDVMAMENGRTMLVQAGLPVLVTLQMREARSAPSRIKAALTIEQEGLPTVALPFAQNTVGRGKGFTPEFRLEQN